MSDLLNYIKMQKNKGLDDYTVLQSAKKFSQEITNMGTHDIRNISKGVMLRGGGYQLKQDEKAIILKALSSINSDVNGYQDLQAAASNSDENANIESYANFDEINKRLTAMKTENISKNPNKNKPNIQNDTYATLQPGSILYYPTQDIKQFDETMMFVDIPNVLDQSKQRSFTMFFTPNEEYAKRYSGIWSLNKRQVYVHKLKVKVVIDRIKIVNSKKIGDTVSNDVLAQGMCGDGIDGYINGIKIEHNLGSGDGSVVEYYICNPSRFFEHEETSMQFSATEWVTITDKKSIRVPSDHNSSGITPTED